MHIVIAERSAGIDPFLYFQRTRQPLGIETFHQYMYDARVLRCISHDDVLVYSEGWSAVAASR
jgi:hypothetical protein